MSYPMEQEYGGVPPYNPNRPSVGRMPQEVDSLAGRASAQRGAIADVVERLSSLYGGYLELIVMTEHTADRFFGPIPTEAHNGDMPREPSTDIERLHYMCDMLTVNLRKLQHQIGRIQQI